MSIFSFICKHFSCKSSCAYNEHEDHLETFSSLQNDLHEHYKLTFDDVKKIENIVKRKPPKNKKLSSI